MPTIVDFKTLVHDYDFAKGAFRQTFSTRAPIVSDFTKQFATRDDNELTIADKLFICQQIVSLSPEYFEPITPHSKLRVQFIQNVLKLFIPTTTPSLNKNEIFFAIFKELDIENKLYLLTHNYRELINLGQTDETLCRQLQDIIITTTNPVLAAQAFALYEEKGGDITNIETKFTSDYAVQLCDRIKTNKLNNKQLTDCLYCLLFLLKKDAKTYRSITMSISLILFNILPKGSFLSQFRQSTGEIKLITLSNEILSYNYFKKEKKAINPDKGFIIPDTATLNPQTCLEGVEIEADWFTRLKDLLTKQNDRDELEKKAGTASNYRYKDELINVLKVIYARLTNKLNSRFGTITQDEKTALLDKLSEGVGNCAPGFDTRMRLIVNNFAKPKTISELLYKIRLELIDKIARSKTDEVHHHNSLFQAARAAGTGVIPPNASDIYLKTIEEDEVNSLKQQFDRLYNSRTLITLLITQIKSELYSCGYRNIDKEEGYTYPEYNCFYEYIKSILGIEMQLADIVLFVDEKVIDINWDFVKTKLSKKLKNEGYFITEKNFSPINSKQELYHNIYQHIKNIITADKGLKLIEFFKDPNSIWHCLSSVDKFEIFTKRPFVCDKNLFALATESNSASFLPLLNEISNLHDFDKQALFRRGVDYNGLTILELAIENNTIFSVLFRYVLNLKSEIKDAILNENSLRRLLKYAIHKNKVTALESILNYGSFLFAGNAPAIFNAFYSAIHYSPKGALLLLSRILELNKLENLYAHFIEPRFYEEYGNLLVYAIKHQPTIVIPLLNTIKSFPIDIKQVIFRRSAFLHYDDPLLAAIANQSDNLELISRVLDTLDTLDHETIFQIFIGSQAVINNLLESNYLQSFTLLLDKIETFPEEVQEI